MAISRKNAVKLKYLWSDEHKIEWIQAFMKIVNKQGKTVPFILTEEQKYFVKNMENKSIILKSRQLGLSSVVVALSIRACIVKDNTTCLLVSHSQKSTNAIFDKLKQQFNSLPNWLKPELLANNRQELKFSNGSKITCTTCGNQDLGRGDTINGICHFSEFAFWKNADRQLNSIMQSLGDDAEMIIESTACGVNKMHDIYFQAKNKENEYKDFFFNWINGRELFENKYKDAVKIWKVRNNNTLPSKNEWSEEEEDLLAMGATIDQLIWRRLEIANNGEDKFKVEYPSTDIECFLNTGNNVFDNVKVNKAEINIKVNKIKPLNKNSIIDLPVALKNHLGRSFFMWKIPESGKRYWLGCDLSEGVKKDFSVVEIIDETEEIVAEFYNNVLKPYEMAEIIDCIGRYYNKGKITIEKASGGHSVIERLRYEYKYTNMTKYRTYDENKLVWQIGFDTKAKSKSIIINDFIEEFQTGKLKINSTRLLNEMKTYCIDENGSMNATTGHDDSVMATALAIAGLKQPFYYTF